MTSFRLLNTSYLLVIPNQRSCALKVDSNGGLLVGACINQRPDLFGCALAHVGVMDMLRFHKSCMGLLTMAAQNKKEEFDWLIKFGLKARVQHCKVGSIRVACLLGTTGGSTKYSPLHNVRRPWEQHPDQPSQYPPTMLLTADHDDRVVPLHSLKLLAVSSQKQQCNIFCARSLENSPQTNPIIGRIECKAGHGAGRPTKKKIDEAADTYSFMARMLDASWNE
ncbi:prolyl endopeptidase-like [Populus alba x Populus x berolinensis]|nr:prolyl endopeptidase-like [Populus alba x Populus x berolinensis]